MRISRPALVSDPLFNSASGHCPTGGVFPNFASELRSIGAFLLALLLLVPPTAFASLSSDDPADEIDRQRVFVDQTLLNVERQRSAQEAEEKSESAARLRTQKKQEELRLAEQLKGLSGTLSGLPELPNFNGKFEMKDERADTKTEES